MSQLLEMFHRPSKKGSKPSFVSYVDKNGKSPSNSEINQPGLTVDDDTVSINSFVCGESLLIPDDVFQHLEPSYLPGEVMIAKADRVMSYIPYSDCKQGVMGSLYVTNFRITFLPVKRTSGTPGIETGCCFLRNKLYNEDDIILNNVEHAYQVSRGRRKKLVPGKHQDRMKKIEIHCKNFRIHQFSLENCKSKDSNALTNAIAHFSFPAKVDIQFTFSYKGSTNYDHMTRVPDFMGPSGWEQEVSRLRAKSFKVTDTNEDYRDSQFMPKYFVVPLPCTSERIRKAFGCYEDYRFPVWSYTHTNGASLLRMTFPLATYSAPQDVEISFLDSVRQIHPEQKPPLVFDVHENFPAVFSVPELEDKIRLPSVREIKTSHDKLKEICMSVTIKELESSDGSWFSTVDTTKWLTYVSNCLKVTDFLAQILTGDSFDLDKKFRRVSVVIKEHDGGRDLTPLVTSLVQVLLDPHARTIAGLQSLIEREWVALGHRFKDRHGIVGQPEQDDKQSPVFLLFLDCLHQLLCQLPQSFEYTETFLMVLWDCVCSGLFGNFLFNSQHEMVSELGHRNGSDRFSRLVDKKLTNNLLNVWDWSKQYSAEDISLFKNPIYVMKAANGNMNIPGKEAPRRIRILSKYYKEKPSDGFIDLDLEEDPPPGEPLVIYPQASVCNLQLWSGCYLRWLTPVQVVGGGSHVEALLQSILVEEIQAIRQQIEAVDRGGGSVGESETATSLRAPVPSPRRRLLESVTSSFPYTLSRPTAQVSFFGASAKMTTDEFTSSSELESSTTSAGDMAGS